MPTTAPLTRDSVRSYSKGLLEQVARVQLELAARVSTSHHTARVIRWEIRVANHNATSLYVVGELANGEAITTSVAL